MHACYGSSSIYPKLTEEAIIIDNLTAQCDGRVHNFVNEC